MMRRRTFFLLLLGLAAAPLACGREEPAGERARAMEGRTREQGGAPAPRPEDGRAAPQSDHEPREIFYDLTAYEWYRQGQPMMVEGEGYHPAGKPEAEGDRRFRPAGRYQGVAFYMVEGEAKPYHVLYVPVFPGYWQPFVPAKAAPQTAD